ncbi:fumarylacetoacetate hydrolase family protein [Mesorhizobium muleiense]|uniref:2-keto-4-pentenoate hydratase/2-oxohepta-3-ene-1,7-dioic acid hydratase (Catechol pathway) n=1 Tax=Mesorhizobium muleiense TaxID=1004279 RepID=A0A1G8VTY5_9HYPH|nr:fumarylacetoacetate hydrolase family protein [Mesorhizobium muleiense]MCF6098607.1 fumarylacetoacetate hydrolase family protein [Mesorhizobium muleiense]SDJ69538.1 2-keto-4-pentenoate hydratase/2-oxohepta-3-ene-1,7-dioic acid hydratase (catechol pathway) [Mesorhizobium muleiense]
MGEPLKFASFVERNGAGYGMVDGEIILRLDSVPGAPPDLKAYLDSRFPDLTPDERDLEALPLAEVSLLPPIPNPGKIFCVAANFREGDKPAPQFPLLFMRHAQAQTGHGGAIRKPAVSDKLDFEGELAVIIGRRAHKIVRGEAMAYVAGYSCFNEGSVRDWQKHSSQFTPGKNFYHSGAFGPWMVCTREIPDPARLLLESRVNGVSRQSIAIDRMIFDIPWLISYISTFAPLDPGDVIVSGTPSGFGASRNPPEFLFPGDEVEIEIQGIGTLRNTVISDQSP